VTFRIANNWIKLALPRTALKEECRVFSNYEKGRFDEKREFAPQKACEMRSRFAGTEARYEAEISATHRLH